MFQRPTLPESTVHFLLSNPRRRHTLQYLQRTVEPVTLRDLSEYVATVETGESPPPRDVRETVYISLAQHHVPALVEQGIVTYDADTHEITPLPRSRHLRVYTEVVTRYGVTWMEYYRAVGILGLCLVVAALAGLPLVSLVDPLLWASGALALFALSTVSQFWRDRYAFQRWASRRWAARRR